MNETIGKGLSNILATSVGTEALAVYQVYSISVANPAVPIVDPPVYLSFVHFQLIQIRSQPQKQG